MKKLANRKYLEITEDYRVSADNFGYMIEKKNSNGNWGVLGYCSNLESVFNSMCEHVTRDNIDNLLFVSKQIKEIREIILRLKTL